MVKLVSLFLLSLFFAVQAWSGGLDDLAKAGFHIDSEDPYKFFGLAEGEVLSQSNLRMFYKQCDKIMKDPATSKADLMRAEQILQRANAYKQIVNPSKDRRPKTAPSPTGLQVQPYYYRNVESGILFAIGKTGKILIFIPRLKGFKDTPEAKIVLERNVSPWTLPTLSEAEKRFLWLVHRSATVREAWDDFQRVPGFPAEERDAVQHKYQKDIDESLVFQSPSQDAVDFLSQEFLNDLRLRAHEAKDFFLKILTEARKIRTLEDAENLVSTSARIMYETLSWDYGQYLFSFATATHGIHQWKIVVGTKKRRSALEKSNYFLAVALMRAARSFVGLPQDSYVYTTENQAQWEEYVKLMMILRVNVHLSNNSSNECFGMSKLVQLHPQWAELERISRNIPALHPLLGELMMLPVYASSSTSWGKEFGGFSEFLETIKVERHWSMDIDAVTGWEAVPESHRPYIEYVINNLHLFEPGLLPDDLHIYNSRPAPQAHLNIFAVAIGLGPNPEWHVADIVSRYIVPYRKWQVNKIHVLDFREPLDEERMISPLADNGQKSLEDSLRSLMDACNRDIARLEGR